MRYTVWHWAAIIGLPVLLVIYLLEHTHSLLRHLDDLANYAGWILILALYLHLLVAAGFYIHDLGTKPIRASSRRD